MSTPSLKITESPPDRLIPLKNSGFISEFQTKFIPKIYSKENTWITSPDSSISYEIPSSSFSSLSLDDKPSELKISSDDKIRNRILAIKRKFDKHLDKFKEYQWDRVNQGRPPYFHEKIASPIKLENSKDNKISLTNNIWLDRPLSRKEKEDKAVPFVPPPVGKVYRLSDIPISKNIVIKSIEKSRKNFPNSDQKRPYSKSEFNLFNCPLAEPLTVSKTKTKTKLPIYLEKEIFNFHEKDEDYKSKTIRLSVINKKKGQSKR